MGALINRIPGSCILIPSLPGSALRTHASRCQQAFLKALPGKLDIKDTHVVFSIYYFVLYLVMAWVGLWSVIFTFPGHTHLLFNIFSSAGAAPPTYKL